jgi:hypothetical protein
MKVERTARAHEPISNGGPDRRTRLHLPSWVVLLGFLAPWSCLC